MSRILLLLILSSSVGCSTGVLTVETTPDGAEVLVRSLSAKEFKSLGPSPVTKPISEVIEMVGGQNSILVETRKGGFVDKSAIIADINTASDVKFVLAMTSREELSEKEGDKTENIENMNMLVDKLFEAQRLVRVGRPDEALRQLEEIEKIQPNLSAIYEIKGGVAFMKKDYNSALDSYSRAVRLNPLNLELMNLKRYLEKSLNVNRQGASVEASQ